MLLVCTLMSQKLQKHLHKLLKNNDITLNLLVCEQTKMPSKNINTLFCTYIVAIFHKLYKLSILHIFIQALFHKKFIVVEIYSKLYLEDRCSMSLATYITTLMYITTQCGMT